MTWRTVTLERPITIPGLKHGNSDGSQALVGCSAPQYNVLTDKLGRRLQPISDFKTSLEPTLPEPTDQPRLAATRNKQIRELIKYEPILAPAAFLLPALAQVSEAVIDLSAVSDSATSALISFGSAANLGKRNSEHRTVKVVVVAGGPGGEAVKILRLSEVQAELEGCEDTQLTYGTIDETEQGFWVSYGSPIQQVCFSEDNGQLGGMLAIRCSTVTTILRPVLRRRPVPPSAAGRSNPPTMDLQPSLLDANPIVDLPINLTGDASHVDVAFNPWDQHQLAVLDTTGRWSIWVIEEQSKSRPLWTVQPAFSGNLPAEEEDAFGSRVATDTWGIILWVYNPNMILVARRSTMILHDTPSGAQQMLGHGLGLEEASEWIFDVKRNPLDSTQLFVLTSSCIFWLRVGVSEDSSNGEARAHILLSRRHFQSYEDRGLQISVSATTKGIMH